MYIADTNVVSETKRKRINAGVQAFFRQAQEDGHTVYISVITVGELMRGVHSLRHNRDGAQAEGLERWLQSTLKQFEKDILAVDKEICELWARLRVPRQENALDKLIAATAVSHGLTVVTRNIKDFEGLGVEVFNPFE